jgi:hypothetical protein
MSKLPVYNEQVFQYSDTVIDVDIDGAIPVPSLAKYVVFVPKRTMIANFGQAIDPAPNLVELTLNNGITPTPTGFRITISRDALRNLRGRYQHELSIVNDSGALGYIFTGELDVKQTNGRYA